jgi:hypothetical protein
MTTRQATIRVLYFMLHIVAKVYRR